MAEYLPSRESVEANIPKATKYILNCFSIYVVVQFYLWLKFSFLLFLGMVMYDNNMIMSLKQKKRKF